MRSLTRFLYRLARIVNDIGAVTSLNPKRMLRRGANKFIGRKLFGRITLPWKW